MNTAYAIQPQQSNQFGNRNDNRASRPKPQFDPIPCTYTELFPQLVAKDMVTPVQVPPLQPLILSGTIQTFIVIIIQELRGIHLRIVSL